MLGLFLTLSLQWYHNGDQINTYFHQSNNYLYVVYYLAVILGLISLAYFGWRLPDEDRRDRLDMLFLMLFFLSTSLLYVGSFHPVLAPNGDNAEYIINARSIIEHGGVYRLDTPARTPNTLASPGLPILLAPIYKIWGLNFYPMKMMILLICLANGGLLFILFRQEFSFVRSALLSMIAFCSPYLVANSNTIMTEGPYLFWSLLSLIFIRKYASHPDFYWRYYFPLIFFLLGSYLTRAVGASLIIASALFLFFNLPAKGLLPVPGRAGRRGLLKLLWLILPFIAGFVFWLIRQQKGGVTPLSIFMEFDFLGHFRDNMVAFANVVGQIFFSPSSFRWYKQSSDFSLSIFNLGWLLILLLLLSAIIYDLIRRKLLAFYSVILLLLLLFASQTPQEKVFMRYLSVLIPFFIYHLHSILHAMESWVRNSKKPIPSVPVPIITIALLGIIYVTNLSSNRYNVLTKSAVFNSYYGSFLNAAQWCGENLPPDAYVMSVKPRIVYLYSDLPGRFLVNDRDVYSTDFEKKKLQEIKDSGVTHIIVDAISRATIDNIHPIIQNNPDKFEKLAVPGLEEKCTVVRVRQF
ncbi:MAG: hypothetical protein KDC80_17345 [Saprospiraceae bacterium]|nr:hypothetical protein [Saprospiraceae bacterium]